MPSELTCQFSFPAHLVTAGNSKHTCSLRDTFLLNMPHSRTGWTWKNKWLTIIIIIILFHSKGETGCWCILFIPMAQPLCKCLCKGRIFCFFLLKYFLPSYHNLQAMRRVNKRIPSFKMIPQLWEDIKKKWKWWKKFLVWTVGLPSHDEVILTWPGT